MYFVHGPTHRSGHISQLGADSERIVRAGVQPHPNARDSPAVVPQRRPPAILRDCEVDAAIAIVVGGRGPALIAEHRNARLPHTERAESAAAVTQQQLPSAGVEAG